MDREAELGERELNVNTVTNKGDADTRKDEILSNEKHYLIPASDS